MSKQTGLRTGADGVTRCWWCGDDPLYIRYHDLEWGRPMHDDNRLFEKICLEGFQSGLSWITILRKRENFREAFRNFDFDAVAKFGKKDVDRLLLDAGIVRHNGKIVSTINNARRAVDLRDEWGSLDEFLWQWKAEPRRKAVTFAELRQVTKSPESIALSKELKRRGWSFVGPTTMYAFMQAAGMVDDHVAGCEIRASAGWPDGAT
jgi:DNA-3-methyladenine glycosylase I